MLQGASLLLVGCGAMGSALLRGWLKTDYFQQGLCVIAPRAEGVAPFITDPRVTHHTTPQDLVAPDILVLAVKPALLAQVLPLYKPFISPTTLVLSVAAGKTLSFYEDILGASQPFVRTMPNTPAAIGQGITLLTCQDTLADAYKTQAEALMQAVGQTFWIPEALFDEASALTGSGPAYIFRFTEALTQAAIRLGIAPSMAAPLARHLVQGAAAYMASSSQSPEDLRIQVTSPGGMTAEALKVFDQQLDTLTFEALKAAALKSRFMGKSS